VGLEVATAAGTEKEEEKGENPFGIDQRELSRARVFQREREREVERVNGSKIIQNAIEEFSKNVTRHKKQHRASASDTRASYFKCSRFKSLSISSKLRRVRFSDRCSYFATLETIIYTRTAL